MNSFHKAEVVPIVLEKHPNADSLSLVRGEGWQCVSQTAQWFKDGVQLTKGIRIQPDSMVDISRPEFTFLAKEANLEGFARIKCVKLRGQVSYGMLVPCDQSLEIGYDAAADLNVKHYNPPETSEDEKLASASVSSAPQNLVLPPTFDLESLAKYFKCIEQGSRVTVQEKVDGCLKDSTLITMSTGKQKEIKDIRVGNIVKSYNEKKQVFEDKKVTNIFIQPITDSVKWIEILLANGNKVSITSNHLVLTKKGYIEAGKLTYKDEIISY